MVEEKSQVILDQTLQLLDTACQASLELLRFCGNMSIREAIQLLQDFQTVVDSVSNVQAGLSAQLGHSCAAEMLENIRDTLEDISRSFDSDDIERAAVKTEFQLFPFLRQLKEDLYFWGTVYPDKEKMSAYYETEFAEHYRNYYVSAEEPSQYRLSVVVSGYNHLETTKRCVEQLLKETDFEKLQAELILIDHGSTDGTLEYFESLHVGKVIHFKRNVRMNMFVTLAQLCQGKYFCFVSNDVLVTHHWAEILLNCLDSDSSIIAAVPQTPHTANNQMLEVPTDDPDEFIRWANTHNRPDHSLWSDRARLMPPLGMYRTEAVSHIGLADPYFHSMEFWDDDFSFRARRAGYRQILCEDVACYHFGSVTGREEQIKADTLSYGRDLFLQKNGIDAWGTGSRYDYYAVQLLTQVFPSGGNIDILGLDCGMGDTLLQLRNELRHGHRSCAIYQLTCQEEYLPDIQPHCERALYVPRLAAGVRDAFETQQFHVVYLGRDIGQYENYAELLEAAVRRLRPGCCMVFSCANPFYAWTVHALLQFTVPTDYGEQRRILVDPNQVRKTAEQYFSQVNVIRLPQNVEGLESFAKVHYGQTEQLEQIMQRLEAKRYYFVCKR